jgi:hypothetical protein
MEVHVSGSTSSTGRGSGRRPRLSRPVLAGLAAAALLGTGLTALGAGPGGGGRGGARKNPPGGTTQPRAAAPGSDGLGNPELPPSLGDESGPAPEPPSTTAVPKADSKDVKAAGSAVKVSVNGLNFRNQRTANGGNQFSVEPPDQALCVGNGFVLESVNDVLRVFDRSGNPVTGVVDLNTFYNYPPAIVRATGVRGPFVTDPSCLYDPEAKRFYHTVLTLDVNPTTGAFLGSNHLDLAVSQSSDPTGGWTIYRIPVQDDGTAGTPDHGCTDGNGKHDACIGDYPHIGTDAHGFYITTNEYELNGPAYKSAQLYYMSKWSLAAGAANLVVGQIDTVGLAGGKPGFTVWPATAPLGQNSKAANGSEFFLSSDAAEEVTDVPGGTSSRRIWVWQLANTFSIDGPAPAPVLTARPLSVGVYSPPPKSDQKAGDFPLGQCINDTTATTPFGPGCWQNLFLTEPAHTEKISSPDSNDTRMQQVTLAGGKLWGALDTAVKVEERTKAGIEAFVVDLSSMRARSGYLAVQNNNVTYPAIGVTAKGKAVVAMTLLGRNYFPSAAYATLDEEAEFGDVKLIAAGAGPTDGFTSYKAEVGDPPRTRWGDYGATALDGSTIWMASEYIAQTCTLAQYLTPPLGSCGGTRAALGNWATRITQVAP